MASQKHRSISETLQRKRSSEHRVIAALDWAERWQGEQQSLVAQLGRELAKDDLDWDELCIIAGGLKDCTRKQLAALPRVLKILGEVTT